MGKKSENDWLKNHTEHGTENDFFAKFGRFELEKQALFVIFLYNEPMQCVDSTITHPSICNDLFYEHCADGNGNKEERKLYLLGNHQITEKFIQSLNVTQLDPFMFIKQ